MKQKLFSIFCCLLLSASMVTQGQVIAVPEGEQLTEQQLRDISMAIQQDAANDVSFVPMNKMKRAGEGSATKTTQRRAAQDYYATWTWSDFNAGGYALEGTVSGSGNNVVKLYRYQWNSNLKIYFAFKTSAAGSYTTPGGTTIVAPKTGNYTIQQSLSDLKVANVDSKLSNKWKNSLYIEDGGNYYFKSGTITVAEGADGPLITSNGVTTNDLSYDYDPISICIGSSPQYCTVSVQSENTTKGTVTSTYQSGYVYSTRSREYKKNSVYRLVATPKSGYHFDHWSDGGAQTHNVTITGNATYTAYFASDATPTHTISTAVSPAGYGTVSGGGTYDENSNRTLTATSANAHLYIFDHWLKNGNTFTGNTSNPLNITVTADATYTAVFRNAAAGTITAEPDDAMHGTVTGGGNYAGGATATLTASPLYDYQFIKWSDGVTTASRTVYVDGNATYTAEFGRVMQINIPNAQCNDATSQSPAWFQFVAEDDEWRVLLAVYSSTFGGSYTESDCALANCKIIDKAENETIMVSTLSATTWSNADGIRRIDANIMGDDGKRYHVVLGAPQQSGASYDNGEDIDLTYTSCSVQTSRPDLYDGSMSFSNDNTRYLKAQKSEGGYTYSLWLEIYTGSGGSIPTGVYPITATNSTGNALAQHTINDYYGVPTLIGGTSLTKYNSDWDDIYFWMIRSGSIAIVNNGGTYFAEVNAINSNGKKVHAIIGTKPNFTVTASGDHGTVTLSASNYANQTGTGTYQYGTRVTLTPVPASGYEFAGWTGTDVSEIREKDGVFSVKVGVKNLNVTPVFVSNGSSCTYEVAFDANGGSGTMPNQEFTCGVAQNLNPNAFTGPAATITYDYHGATSGNGTPSVTVNKPFGVWEAPDEDVDDEAEVNFSASNGETITLIATWNAFPNVTLPTPARTGYTFNGWYTEETGGTKKGNGGASFNPAGNITLHAQWTINTYTVSIVSNNNEYGTVSQASVASVPYGTVITTGTGANANKVTINGTTVTATPATATAQYTYAFDGWTNGTATVTGNTTVTATFTRTTNTYTILWKNGEVVLETDENVAYGATPAYNGATPTKDATAEYTYAFNAWTPAVVSVTGDATYTATFTQTPVNYTLTWTTDGDALTGTYTSGTVAYGTTIVAPATPTKTGYTFAGWNVTPASTMPAANTTYTAQWTAIDYEINFHGNGGTGSFLNLTYTIEEEDDIVLWTDEDIEKTGYTFGGWYDNVGLTGNPVTTIPAGSTGNKDFYAKWIINTYTITWKNADGTTLETDENVAYGTTPTYNGSIPTKEADSEYTYAFNGWSPAVATVTTDATYTAAYSQTKVQYTLTWNFDGGTTATAEGNYTHGLIDWGTAITAPANPTKDGYTFNGWNTTPAATMPAANVTYTAQWISAAPPVVLLDNEPNTHYNTFKSTYDGAKGVVVTYERQFTEGRWSTLCLPFNVNKAMFSNLNFGSRIYEFKYATGNADDGVNLYFSIAKSIEAGKGYIVNADDKLAKRTSFTFRGVNIDLSADSVAELNSAAAYDKLGGTSTEGNIELVGTLRKGTLKGTAADNRYMGLKENKIYYPNITTGSTILAYRGIFRSIEGTLNAERIRIIVDGEEKAELEVINGELQDVQETKKFIENGVLYIERNGIIYDATGRKVE